MDDKTNPQTPVRSFIEEPDIQWRYGKPNFEVVDRAYLAGKIRNHPVGSLEKTVENLVKTWEMESTHKMHEKDWQSVDKKVFFLQSNGGRKFNLAEQIQMGNYNLFFHDSVLYNSDLTSDESLHLFQEAFNHGFPWEVLDVISGPPKVCFTWRHWGKFEGPYNGFEPTGKTLEMTGFCVVNVTEDLKIQSIDVFFDPHALILKLMGCQPFTKWQCPFVQLRK
ncbi:uncharacterized protein LOC127836145 [Dreissena polymorpha]|uniref:Pathogen-related protein n=1 Tax=Dreissena polymorpha TaxID=45954 RepID=A0A9D4RWK5_DREPO|nr:uncharacterized protein LOC127836145 [Dreissena polymorpha]XP_052218544.1 uncharacterized protein LOC127836145 [Dreissena polymorpha]XP_052218551.1 uncharacterized protein LOC127836145 [Dreissena polymorpha]KAH3884101.1 hypothetical protein DPMN_008074 [Dreissena polymorpha]